MGPVANFPQRELQHLKSGGRLLGLGADKFMMQAGIKAVLTQQTEMCAALGNPSLVQHQDQISFTNRAQAVGDDERRSSAQQNIQ